MLDRDDFDLNSRLEDLVDDPVVPSAGTAFAGELEPQGLADSVRILSERTVDELRRPQTRSRVEDGPYVTRCPPAIGGTIRGVAAPASARTPPRERRPRRRLTNAVVRGRRRL